MDTVEQRNKYDIDQPPIVEDKRKIRTSIEADIERFVGAGGRVSPQPRKMSFDELRVYFTAKYPRSKTRKGRTTQGTGSNSWEDEARKEYKEREHRSKISETSS